MRVRRPSAAMVVVGLAPVLALELDYACGVALPGHQHEPDQAQRAALAVEERARGN